MVFFMDRYKYQWGGGEFLPTMLKKTEMITDDTAIVLAT